MSLHLTFLQAAPLSLLVGYLLGWLFSEMGRG